MDYSIAAILAESRVLGQLPELAIDKLAEAAVVRSYPKGQIIFHQGDAGEALYVIAEGVVKLHLVSPAGSEMVVATLHPTDAFGELAIIDDGPRSATASALEPARLIAIRRATFLTLLREHPFLMESLLKVVGELVRSTLERAGDLVFLDLPGRIAKRLLSIADERGETTQEGVAVDLELTQGDFAAMVGGSRPKVNQILRSFEERGWLRIEGRRVIIVDSHRLSRRISF